MTSAAARKIFSYLLKASILVLAGLFIYHRVNNNKNLREFQTLVSGISRNQVMVTMTLVLLLMILNWVLESLKWQYLARKLVKISLWQAIEGVFCGLTWAVFTPNRIGEYGGRVLFLPNRKRIYGVFVMAVGSFGQNVITNFTGLAASLWFIYHFLNVSLWLYLCIAVLTLAFLTMLLIFYFNIRWLVLLLNKIPLAQ